MEPTAATLTGLKTPSRPPASKLPPIPSLLFYNNNHHTQDQRHLHGITHLNESTASSREMNDSTDASGPGSQSHETSISPPPAKRQRRAKDATNSTKLTSTRSSTRNVKVLSSSSSMNNTQSSTPDIVEASAPPSAAESRASSIVTETRPSTRSGKRKLERFESETPSIQDEVKRLPSGIQLANELAGIGQDVASTVTEVRPSTRSERRRLERLESETPSVQDEVRKDSSGMQLADELAGVGQDVPSTVTEARPSTRSEKRRLERLESETPSVQDEIRKVSSGIQLADELAGAGQDVPSTTIETRPSTRLGRRKLERFDSETPSVQDEVKNISSSTQLADELASVDRDTPLLPDIIIGTPDETESRTEEQETNVSRRGRPPGSGRGRGGGRGGRGRGGRGRGGVALTRQNSGVPETIKRTVGRGARGKKTSTIHKVQASYDRQSDLKKSFREVSRLVRVANDILAEKELERMDDDPRYHEKLPQFPVVEKELGKYVDKAFGANGKLYEYRAAHAKKKLLIDAEYEEIRYQCEVEDQREIAQLRCKAAVLEQIQDAKPATDEHSSVRPTNQFDYKMLAEEMTDIVGLPFGSAIQDDASIAKKAAKKGSPKKRTLKETVVDEPVAKRHSILSAVTAPPEEPDDGELSILPTLAETNSPVVTSSAETPEPGAKLADGDKGPTILFPEKTRRGRATEPNNRAVVKPWFEFEKGEIALRSLYHEFDHGYQQPERFYIDSHTGPAGVGELLSAHKAEDFDQEQIARHHLHAQYGVPIPGTINPDDAVPPTDFSKPLARTRPVCFINKAETIRIETSRSATLVHAANDWNHFEAVMAMKSVLGNYDVRDLFTTEGLATFDVVAREHGLTKEIVDQVLQAAKELEEVDGSAPKRRKTGSQSGTLAPIQRRAPYSYSEFQDEAFAVPRILDEIPEKFRAAPNKLQILADMADHAQQSTIVLGRKQNTIHHPAQTGVSPTAPVQSSSRKRKYSGAQPQSSPQMMAPPAPPAQQPVPSQAMAPPPRRSRAEILEAAVVASYGVDPSTLTYTPQVAPSQPMTPQSMGPPSGGMAQQSAGTQNAGAQNLGLQNVGPPNAVPQNTAPQNSVARNMGPPVAPQHISSQATGPPTPGTQNMAPPPMAPQRIAQKLTGTPPVLPQPTNPSFTRSRSSSDQNRVSQSMLPPPTPSQLASPHLSQAQGYYPAAPQQQMLHQQMSQQQMHQHQPPQQQHQHQSPQHQPQPQPQQIQLPQPPHPQQPSQPTPPSVQRSHRSGPPNSGLRDILPRPELKGPSSRPSNHGNRSYYDPNPPMMPYQGPPGPGPLPQVERGYGYAPSDPRHHVQMQYQGPPPQRVSQPSQHYHNGPPQHMGSPLPPHQGQPMQPYQATSSYHNSTFPKKYQDYAYGEMPQQPMMRNPDPYVSMEMQFQHAESPRHQLIVEQQVQQQAQRQAQQQAQQAQQPPQKVPPRFFTD